GKGNGAGAHASANSSGQAGRAHGDADAPEAIAAAAGTPRGGTARCTRHDTASSAGDARDRRRPGGGSIVGIAARRADPSHAVARPSGRTTVSLARLRTAASLRRDACVDAHSRGP